MRPVPPEELSAELQRPPRVLRRLEVYVTLVMAAALTGAMTLFVDETHPATTMTAQLFRTMIALSVFALMWATRRLVSNPTMLVAGIGYAFVGGLHAFQIATELWWFPDGPTKGDTISQIWLAGALFEILVLLGLPALLHRRVRIWQAFLVYGTVSNVLAVAILLLDAFPTCRLPGGAPTLFATAMLWFGLAMVAGAGTLFWRARSDIRPEALRRYLVALAAATGSLLFGHLSGPTHDSAGLASHMLDFIATALVYRALVSSGIANPFRTMHRELDDSERTHRLALEATQDGLIDWDVTTGITHFNPSAIRFLGGLESPAPIDAVLRDIHPEDMEAVHDGLAAHLRGETPRWQASYRQRDSEGHWRWLHGHARVVSISRDGQPRRVIGTFRDITHYRQDRERLRLVTEAVSDFVFEWCQETDRVQWFGDLAERLGCDDQEVPSSVAEWLPLLEPEDAAALQDAVARAAEGARSWQHVFRLGSNGQFQYWELRALRARFGISDREMWVGACTDITRQRQIEDGLRQTEKMKAVGRLAGGIAHDFNNILQAVKGYTDMALLDLRPGTAAYDNLMETRRATRRAARLTRQLLTFSRRDRLEPEHLDVGQVVDDLVRMLRRLIGGDVELVVRSADDLHPVLADRTQLEQIVLNLCLNARDAMPQGGVLTVESQNAELSDGERERLAEAAGTPAPSAAGWLALTVSDTGTGITPEVKQRIFDPFFTTKEPGKGTGLGLSTTYSIVQRHGGLLDVSSELGAGSVFRVLLPSAAGVVVGPVPAADAPIELPAGGDETLLLAEDDELVRGLAASVLTHAGYRVLVARDGEEAIRILDQKGEDVAMAIVDVVMPRGGGAGVFSHVRDRFPDMPFLFVSGHTGDALTDGALADADLLAKPFSPASLLRRVRAELDAS